MDEKKLSQAMRNSKPKTYSESEIIKKVEEFRKKECFCDEIDDGDICSKCGQMLPSKPKKCYICQICDDILSKFLTPSGFSSAIDKVGLRGLTFLGGEK